MFPEAALIVALTMNVRFTKEEKTQLLELLHPELGAVYNEVRNLKKA